MENIYQIKNLRYKYLNSNNYNWSIFGKKEKKLDENVTSVFELGPIDLEISRGKLTTILGRSGSGKTTLLSIIGLLRQASEGDININIDNNTSINELWENENALELFRSQYLGFALQKGELLPHLSLFENAALVSSYLNKDETNIRSTITQHFQSLFEQENKENSLNRVMHHKPSNVSQGQYQRGAIVRALANNPSIILADEPTGNLDIHAGEKTMSIFQQIVRDDANKSVIVVTHDRKLAVDFADAIIILKEGKVKAKYSVKSDNESWLRVAGGEQDLELNTKDALMVMIGKDLD